jgi:hypothetical protein
LGAAVLVPLATAAPSYAAAPTAGAGCQSSDGKIAGRGSTLATFMQFVFMSEFSSDVCGGGILASSNANGAATGATPAFGAGNDLTGPNSPPVSSGYSGGYNNNWMTAYNGANDFGASFTGSGNGQKSVGCRNAAFAGTDVPATSGQYTSLNGAAGTIGSCNPANLIPQFDVPPGQAPTGTCPGHDGCVNYPGLGDTTRTIMTVPIGISAIRLFADLPTSCWNASTQGAVPLTQADVAGVFGGSYLNWQSVGALAANANCNVAIQRWVRADNSGTTQGMNNYLADSNGYATATCAADQNGDAANFQSLQNLQVAHNSNADQPGGFPNGVALPAGHGLFDSNYNNGTPSVPANASIPAGTNGSCSAIWAAGTTSSAGASGQSGGPALITGAECTNGASGYADSSDAQRDPGYVGSSSFAPCPNLLATNNMVILAVPAAIGGSDVTETSGCSAGSLPSGGTPNAAVGLGATWQLTAANTPNGSPSDIAFTPQGTGYPVCTLTWDLTYTGQNGNAAPAPTTTGYAANAASIPVNSLSGLPNAGTFTAAGNTISYTSITAAAGVNPATLNGVTGDTNPNAGGALTFAKGNGGPNAQLTADQRRTLYMYFLYILSPLGQSGLNSAANFGSPALPYGQGYFPLPAGWLSKFSSGFMYLF